MEKEGPDRPVNAAPDHDDLVEWARSGDAGAFEALYQRHRAQIHTFLRYLVRDREEAADLTQQVFMRAWDGLPRLRKAGAFVGWLHRIAANLARDWAKSARVRSEAPMPQEADLASQEDASEGVLEQEMRHRVQEAVAALPEIHRGVVVMHHVEGLSVNQIAQALGVSPGTVMSRVARAREALRERLGPYLRGEDEADHG